MSPYRGTIKSITSSREIIMILTFFVASTIFVPFVEAFRSSITASTPILTSFEPSKQEAQHAVLSEEVVSEKKFKYVYDLGVGKNPPVINKYARDELPSLNREVDPTQFLIEHESVRPYPSPLDLDSRLQKRTGKNQNELKQSDRKSLPKVHHRRHSDDIFRIQDPICNRNAQNTNQKHKCSCLPTIVPMKPKNSVGSNAKAIKLDPNTVWVEMMLHHEHSKTISNKR